MKIIVLSWIVILSIQLSAQNISEWRGPDRTGVYSEIGLLKQWPEEGPEMLWAYEDLPKGYSSVSLGNGLIYCTGKVDTMDAVIAIDKAGKFKWKTAYGRAWDATYPESRSTPTLENDRLYVSSGSGDVACLNALDGSIIWKVEASKTLNGTFGRWGLAESLLIYEDKVFFTPGGKETTMIALDKKTGDLIWKSESIDDAPSYTSPLLINHHNKKIIVNTTASYVIGVLPENGKILWKFNFKSYSNEKGWNNQTNTPLYYNGKLYVTSGYDHKGVMLELSKNGNSVSFVWSDEVLDVHHGGVVKVGDYIYGANWMGNRMGHWICLDWESGEMMYNEEWINKGSIISAEGMLYCYEEKTGNIALVKADPKEFKIISSFKINLGNGPHWSHLVIKDGILYVRHGNALMAFDIKEK
ncbi:MAG: PQQ-like beta-propeller repeat protein [Bacteroidetes bacterium]|nr:PQQ-like beta-propeller repeat protein [Bacteroidota bacterium]